MKDSTRRTLRTTVAALVALAAMAPVLVAEAGLDPDRWPWLAAVLAACAAVTRLMASPTVERFLAAFVPWLAKDTAGGRHEAGRNWGSADPGRGDAGRARAAAVLVLALAVVLIAVIPASAARPWHRGLTAVHPQVVTTEVCDGTLLVVFDVHALGPGRAWMPVLDDGSAGLELHETSGRSGPLGVWEPPPKELGPVMSGGEHRLRWAGWGRASGYGLHFDQVRVTAGGFRSVPVPIEGRCAA